MEDQIHLIEYNHSGAKWILRVSAPSEDEAWQRLNTAAQFGTYLGVQIASYSAGLGPLARLRCWIENMARRLVTPRHRVAR
ncbi:MAG: hypothetical protein ACHQ50_03335 [Fimbriimonadales bacterium]